MDQNEEREATLSVEKINSDANKMLRLTPPLPSDSSAILNSLDLLGGGVKPSSKMQSPLQQIGPVNREASGGVSRSILLGSELNQIHSNKESTHEYTN